MTQAKPLPPVEFLRECFLYDPDTGALFWRHRPDHHFQDLENAKQWNARLSGTPALATQTRKPNGEPRALRGEFLFRSRRFRVGAHRVIFKMQTGEEPDMVDHRNGDPFDNRWRNLRAATAVTNRRNNRGRAGGLPKCVVLDKRRFRAVGSLGHEKVRLGSYRTPAEAHAAWCVWAKPIHGEFFNPGPKIETVFD